LAGPAELPTNHSIKVEDPADRIELSGRKKQLRRVLKSALSYAIVGVC
jgi:hypothetical protein